MPKNTYTHTYNVDSKRRYCSHMSYMKKRKCVVLFMKTSSIKNYILIFICTFTFTRTAKKKWISNTIDFIWSFLFRLIFLCQWIFFSSRIISTNYFLFFPFTMRYKFLMIFLCYVKFTFTFINFILISICRITYYLLWLAPAIKKNKTANIWLWITFRFMK